MGRFPVVAPALGVLLTSLVALPGCSSSPSGPATVTVSGVTVSLTPNPAVLASTAQATAQVSPSGASQTVTWTSSDPNVATVNSTGLVTPLLRGTVTITATSTADPTKSGSVTLTIVCPDPRHVTAPINVDTTWDNWIADPSCFDYVVERDLQFNSQLLTIEPGTVVGFGPGLGLRVRIDAGLKAEGTASEPIRLTGLTSARGSWKGVALDDTDHPDNVLAYTTIEYSEGIVTGGMGPAALALNGPTVVRIENSTFRQSTGFGLALGTGVMINGAGNSLTENGSGPAWTMGTEVPDLTGFAFSGNDTDAVVVRPTAIAQSATWPSALYHVLLHTSQAFTVTGGNLTLSPGTELRFEGGQAMVITAGASLTAVGTASAPIVLTGTAATPGHWGGLGILQTGAAMNRLDHVVIEYGGGQSLGSRAIRANLTITHAGAGAQASISNTTLRGSAEYGMYATVGTSLLDFQNNMLTGNTLGAAFLDAPLVDHLTGTSSFTGNTNDEIVVAGGATNTLTDQARWRDVGVPYNLRGQSGNQMAVTNAWTVDPGVEILFAPDVGVVIKEGGSLTAEGTQNDHIRMQAKTTAWQGIAFENSMGSFDYADISNAGSVQWGQVGAPGAVTIIATSIATPSVVSFKPGINITNSPYALVFSAGPSIAYGCPAPFYIPPPDQVSDHCK